MRWLVPIALLLLAPLASADENRGILLTRDAQKLIAEGRAEEALLLLEEARVEWPDSPVVSQTLADAQLMLGNFGEALAEYERGSRDGYEHRSRFNSAVTLDVMAETRLSAANVPLDPAGLPEGPQPEMLTAINEALPVLEGSRGEFLRALDETADGALAAAARESIGAVNRRIDDLREMAEELQRRQDEQEDEESEDQDEEQEEGDEESDEEQDDQEGDEEQDEEQQPGENENEEPQDDQQPDEGEGDPDEQDQEGGEQPEPSEPRLLSREEVQQLLEKLDELEKEGRELRKMREAAARRTVEKDW
ncbi:MAG: tetratricopeptide repeat protein [Planctomycetota bacterium]|jgi:hypothetical protein